MTTAVATHRITIPNVRRASVITAQAVRIRDLSHTHWTTVAMRVPGRRDYDPDRWGSLMADGELHAVYVWRDAGRILTTQQRDDGGRFVLLAKLARVG